jgi:hypothetical protein
VPRKTSRRAIVVRRWTAAPRSSHGHVLTSINDAQLSAVSFCYLPSGHAALARQGEGVDRSDHIVVRSGMSSVEVLGAVDGYPPLLTIDEAAEVLRIGSCIRVPRWALAESADHRPCRAPGRWTASLTPPALRRSP